MSNRNASVTLTVEIKPVIVECLKFIDEHIYEQLNLDIVSKHTGYSKYYFGRAFKQYIGFSIMEYVKRRKLTFASADLLEDNKIIEVGLKYGYDSPSSFTKAFNKEFGFSPSMLRTMKLQLSVLKGGHNMNHIFLDQMEIHSSKEELFSKLLELINNKSNYNIAALKKAYVFACKAYNKITRYSGDEYVTHPLNVAIILAYLEAREEVVICGMLCDIFTKTNTKPEQVEKEFSSNIKYILLKLECFDKSSVNMAEDEDVIMIKLAERLHNMRTIEFMDEIAKKVKAKETIEFFIPYASTLGNTKLIEELNDLSLKYA